MQHTTRLCREKGLNKWRVRVTTVETRVSSLDTAGLVVATHIVSLNKPDETVNSYIYITVYHIF